MSSSRRWEGRKEGQISAFERGEDWRDRGEAKNTSCFWGGTRVLFAETEHYGNKHQKLFSTDSR